MQGATITLADQTQVPTSEIDFYHPGSQPDPLGYDWFTVGQFNCINCHKFDDDNNPDEVVAPYNNWMTSMMAQASRDPIFHAAMTIANQDAKDSGVMCIRCHMPTGYLMGRGTPADGSALIEDDYDGISCDFCHRSVDPVSSIQNPVEDIDILDYLVSTGDLPTQPGNGSFIIDPIEVRRGPLDDVGVNMHSVPIIYSTFHEEALFCGSCHDLSNPVLSLQSDGSYLPNAMDAPHPNSNIYEMMPEQRTYSEWLHSSFATDDGVIFSDGRFTGNNGDAAVHSCQDCHMPANDGADCVFWELPDVGPRENVPTHSFVGSNSWVLGAVRNLYDDSETGLSDESILLNQQRTHVFMEKASDMEISSSGNDLNVRVINMTGHSLPTGYPEGRRIWINLRFFDSFDNLIQEHGTYDLNTAELTTDDTKVYETIVGISEKLGNTVGLPPGESFHLVLNNVVLSDNRIPPMGFTNAAFEAIQAAPVNYSYEDGQHWDDTSYAIPECAEKVIATLYHQTTSKEYIEFLRDANVTDDKGQIAYEQWELEGKSAPLIMDTATYEIPITPILGDVNGDGTVNVKDLLFIINSWGECSNPKGCDADINEDGIVDVQDLLTVIASWSACQ
ncbi:MAG TPA: dockerin type I domain-containing protein [Phycisphaerales bacterium]|nr:dockerin type I domain-containing protein [Phycisphaerales bacterium]